MGSPYTEYPRGPMGGSGGQMRGTPRGAVDIAAIGEAWELMKANWTPFALAALLAGIVFYAIMFVATLPFLGSLIAIQSRTTDQMEILAAQVPMRIVTTFVQSVLIGPMIGGFAHMSIALLRGEAVSVNHFFRVFPKIHLYIGFGLLYTLLTYVGVLACVLGTFVVAGLLMIAPLYMADRDLGPIEAIKASFNALKGEWVMASVFYLITSIIACVGVLACCVGVLFTVPLAMLSVGIVYRDVAYVGASYASPASPASPPPSEAPMAPPSTEEEPPAPPSEG